MNKDCRNQSGSLFILVKFGLRKKLSVFFLQITTCIRIWINYNFESIPRILLLSVFCQRILNSSDYQVRYSMDQFHKCGYELSIA